MKQTKITCDECDHLLCQSEEDLPMCVFTLIGSFDQDKHFCDDECLKQWVNK
jgi:hypothetical protein